MSKIKDIVAREILDSRGNPTIEVKVFTEKGSVGIFSVPSGASTGKKEALELRDNDERYMGKGVRKAVSNVNNIIKDKLIGFSVENQKSIDELLISLDGTPNKSNLGANAILGVSVACLKAAALDNNEELFRYLNKREAKIPYCMFNILNGGKHAPNNVDIQEFMIVPKFDDFKTSLRVASEIFHNLKTLLEEKELVTSVGDEGGFAPDLDNNEEALMILVKSIEMSGYIPGKNVFIAYSIGTYISTLYDENAKTELVLNIELRKDGKDGSISLYKVDYTPIYVLDRGKDAQNRYELIDMKSAANNYTSGNPYGIDRETYDKLIQGLKKLANSSNGLK